MKHLNRQPRQGVEVGKWVIYGSAGMAFFAVVLLFLMIAAFALTAMLQGGESTPFSWVWQPSQGEFGILPMIVGSLLLALLALLISFPLSVAVACWLMGIGKGKLRHLVEVVIRFMTTVPTVVYGFVAIFLLTPLIRQGLGGAGMSWLAASIMVAILIVPTIVMVMVAGLAPKLEKLSSAGLALGFSKFELLCFFILPQGRKTLLSAGMLGFGRAIGDTLLPLMLAGNATQVPGGLSESLRTLTAHMALVTANEVGGAAYNSLFIAGFLLLLVNAILSIAIKRLTRESSGQQEFATVSKKSQSKLKAGGDQ